MLIKKIKQFGDFCLNFATKNRNSFFTAIVLFCAFSLWMINVKISHETKVLKLEKEKASLTQDLNNYFDFVSERSKYIQTKDKERSEMIRALEMQSQVIRQLIFKIEQLGGLKRPPEKPINPDDWT